MSKRVLQRTEHTLPREAAAGGDGLDDASRTSAERLLRAADDAIACSSGDAWRFLRATRQTISQ